MEGTMHGKAYQKTLVNMCIAASFICLCTVRGYAQEAGKLASANSPSTETVPEIHALTELIHDLQSQMQELNSQLGDLRAEQQRTSEEAKELRRELDLAKSQTQPPPAPADQSTPVRLAKLEENQEVIEAKVNDQYQTKIESGSKYRLRLSGIVLLNLYENRGTVDNQDFPQFAPPPQANPIFVSPASFGGSLRQSQLKLQAFGPNIAGARTSADVEFDFAGGFPAAANGSAFGLMRLRTGTMRLDWTNTSIVAGQDRLFFAPLAPTSVATLATPALSYAGNLWAWSPQVRIEHRFVLSDSSNLSLQAGIIDSLTGDYPDDTFARYPSWGEESGQPSYATRIAWSHRMYGENFTVGVGGYYGRQNWGLNRTFDGWAGTVDVTLPLGKQFEFTGAFYRGRGAGGFGAAIGQTALLTGSFGNPATIFRGVDSMGGWAQLKFKLKPNFEINGALGVDSPFAGELRDHTSNSIYPSIYTRNLSPMVNVIYQVRSDILISTEYRWLQTSILDSGSNHASHINLSMGYIF
jgi:hypothetical protein